MKKKIISIISMLSVIAGFADRLPDNVVISDAAEEYTFEQTRYGLVVKTVEKSKYEATRHSDKVVPHVFYNNVISLDKVSGGKPDRRNVNAPNVFHDDSYICYFPVELKEKGATAKTEFRRTFKDPAYFTRLSVLDMYPVNEKVLKFRLPAYLTNIEFIEKNFPQDCFVRDNEIHPDGSRTVTYTFTNLPASKTEKREPPMQACEPIIYVQGYFPDVDSLYRYHKRLVDVDTVIPDVNALLAEILDGATERDAKINRILDFVGKRIRYVAFEEGEAGYRPDNPAEVLRKRFGDCKGMALLLKTLLNRVGVEAYIGAVGTRSIPYKISEMPSLGATNHMICVVPDGDRHLFLDATNEYNSAGHISYSIQGKDVMMFKDDGFELIDVPRLGAEVSTDLATYSYRLNSDETLTGSLSQQLRGDMIPFYKARIDGANKKYQDDLIERMIRPRRQSDINRDSLKLESCGEAFSISAPLTDASAATVTDNAIYIDLNTSDNSIIERIDTSDRTKDYVLPFPCIIERRSELTVPDGMTVGELPEGGTYSCAGVELSCKFDKSNPSVVTMTKTVKINDVIIPFAEIPQWNRTVAAWNDACDQQIELLIKRMQ
ncbi:MAG: hypothetical protein K2K00_08670 [Muribaculaceae bacterium]|nr:hypothetical protein [Muribaculaceae bacterium]